jgi:hypothetical protein
MVLLTGCTESRGTKLAKCTMEAMKHSTERYERLGFTNICMRAEGYVMTDDINCQGRGTIDHEARCFISANPVSRAFDSVWDKLGR